MNRYAPGRRAWGECARSGARALLRDLVFDGRFPNLRVLPDWREDRHPQESLPKVDDAIALFRPSPENLHAPSTPVLSGDSEDGTVTLLWTESTSEIALVNTYLIYRASGVDGEFELLATFNVVRDVFAAIISANTYADDTVAIDTQYRYYIVARAIDGGDSAPSNTVSIAAE